MNVIIFLIYAIPFIAVLAMIKSLYLLKTSRLDPSENKNVSVPPFSLIRTRGSVRQGMNKVKSLDFYYELEKNITFPKR